MNTKKKVAQKAPAKKMAAKPKKMAARTFDKVKVVLTFTVVLNDPVDSLPSGLGRVDILRMANNALHGTSIPDETLSTWSLAPGARYSANLTR